MGPSDARLLLRCRQQIKELQLENTRLKNALEAELEQHDESMRQMADLLSRYTRWHYAVWHQEPPRSNGMLRRLDIMFELTRGAWDQPRD